MKLTFGLVRLVRHWLNLRDAFARTLPLSDWIPVSERLPDENDLPEDYDVTLWNADEPDYYEVVVARYDVDGRWITGNEMDVTADVIAWQPLPAAYVPPAEGESKDA